MKLHTFVVNSNMIHYKSSIRSRIDIIRLLIEISCYLITEYDKCYQSSKKIHNEYVQLIIAVDKMSRIFLSEKNKIHSFCFPFNCNIQKDKCILSYKGFEIDNTVCAVLRASFNELEIDFTIEEFLERYWEIISDFEISKKEQQLYDSLIAHIFSFETGYLRYDHDIERKDINYHPEYHLDINYTGSVSFKIGLKTALNDADFVDILNLKSPCSYLICPKDIKNI